MAKTPKTAYDELITVLIADDHDVVQEGVRLILNRPGFEIVGAVGDGKELYERACKLKPHVLIVDISMPRLGGIEAVRRIREKDSDVKVVFLTMHPEISYASDALTVGGAAYVLKSSAGRDLIKAIDAVLQGRLFISPVIAEAVKSVMSGRTKADRPVGGELTPRQIEVLQLLTSGATVKEIASKLNVSPRTIEFHKYRIMKTIGAKTVVETAVYAARHGLIP